MSNFCSSSLSTNDSPRRLLVELLVIAAVVTLLTSIACEVFPLWDGGLVWLQSKWPGNAVIAVAADRPLLGRDFSRWMADSGHLQAIAAALHWVTWFGIGVTTLCLWKLMFPRHARFALAAACLAVAPVLCRIQFELLVATASGLEPSAVWLAMLPFMRPNAVNYDRTMTAILRLLMAVVAAAVTLLSEYAIPTALVGSVLIWRFSATTAKGRRSAAITIACLLAAVVGSYVIYHGLANAASRPAVRPEMQDFGYRGKWLLPRTVTSLWEVTIGTLLQRLGSLESWSTKESLAGLAAGLAGGLGLWLWVRQPGKRDSGDTESDLTDAGTLWTLLVALLVGILPVVVMGRGFRSWTSSRFWFPALPLAACTAVYALLRLVRPRAWWAIPLGCGLLAGYGLVNDGLLAIHERRNIAELAEQLKPFVSDDGLTVAIVNREWKYPLPYPSDGELTARLTYDWPEAKRRHFWAIAGMEALAQDKVLRDGRRTTILDDPFGPHPELLRDWEPLKSVFVDQANRTESSGVAAAKSDAGRMRAETVTNLLWVTEAVDESDGKMHIGVQQLRSLKPAN